MKLHYYDGKSTNLQVGNFGDDLNPWLWMQLIPNILDGDGEKLFVGIGTLLNEHLPKNTQKIIFGSGVGYGKIPNVDSTWKIYFVRGPLSARALNLEASLGITDPAILVRQCFAQTGQKKYRWSYIPHFSQEIHNGGAWQEICQSLNIHYINPTASIEQVLTEISESDILFAEAMHGAIIADAFRTPWVAVKTNEKILDFKWNDWLNSVGLTYQPHMIKRIASLIGKKSFLRACDYQSIRTQMYYMLITAKPFLSNFSKSKELEERVMLKLEALKTDVTKGLLN
ncbi:polysaccharide pyruvyl transferase family protein [Anabaena cylindrica FACHB-243]|uniref:ExoV-like protein n=1 Tax=Anabaena cylindrica (strain ATCC 27899 / PCC 7122) TaxID=272123 RepID=K9ZIV0_ANACC|nr:MULTISPECIES: polysaccharide pyruvyl transferase family protein [Anabaena]AFZ59163.1 ExoV-like protein [Anabaena cylindrica PCC 7122]MBD2416513.1 polysaccharide pyruvyl transferase family protein [Anabaena cylindrica FACHB-243]MBY5281085.1 polysaccharide pyruvyl transferase family protein [Anabaena sp. CCAP 1446/1C]MBY5309872.1 polysaccharide pyruvyl transferase family protein [Anabaena sp. CCAP 1446/1C]MCM2407451.1 polysaccharide pyruvyl transferase family protein [Anabaena sp. CCAP 1446/1